MALFKIFKGSDSAKITNSTVSGYRMPTDGYAYYDTSTKLFYIDADYNDNGTITRSPINAGMAIKLATARSLKTKLNSTTAVTFDGSADQNAIPVTGTLPIGNGGTGATTAGAAANNLLVGLPTWTSDPNDDTYFIRRDLGGGDAFGQVKASTIYNYIASKTTVSNTWTDGTIAGPTIKTTVNGVTGTAVAIPVASKTASGVITTGAQSFLGRKTFGYVNRDAYNDSGTATRWACDTQVHNAAGNIVAEYWYDTGDATNVTAGRWGIRAYSPASTASTTTTGHHETFSLPNVNTGRTTDASYNIITTKNPADLGYYLPLTGGTLTGDVTINKTGEPAFIVDNTSDHKAGFMIGSSSKYAGIWDYTNSKWIVYSTAAGAVTLNGNANTATKANGLVDGTSTMTSAYNKAGLAYADYSWLAGWNGYELRAVAKTQFAQASHSHAYLPLAGGTMNDERAITFQITRKKDGGGGWAYTPLRMIDNTSTNFFNIGVYGSANTFNYAFIGANSWDSTANTRIYADGHLTAPKVYGAVWNDYAEYRKDNPNENQEPGRCIRELGDGSLALTTKRLERGCEIVSDTFGFAIGQDEENGYNTPIASNGRVLAYPYESIEEFASHIGWPVCSGPNGTVSIMTEEEEEKYPSRIIGTISEIPDYEEWGTGKVKVDGRIWIRIR